jgi:hypothetical protein
LGLFLVPIFSIDITVLIGDSDRQKWATEVAHLESRIKVANGKTYKNASAQNVDSMCNMLKQSL